MMSMLSVVIPTYNECGNVHLLAKRLGHSLAVIPHELIFVDDNSPDGTSDAILTLASADPRSNILLVKRSGKLGLTSAVVAGVDAAHGELIAVMDADLSHPTELIPELVKALENGADIAVGSRFVSGGKVENWPLHRQVISGSATLFGKLLLGIKAKDSMSGLFAVRREIFQNTRFRTKGYKLLLNILHDNPNAWVVEVPYTFRDRFSGKTKLDSREMIGYVFDVLRIRFKKGSDARRC